MGKAGQRKSCNLAYLILKEEEGNAVEKRKETLRKKEEGNSGKKRMKTWDKKEEGNSDYFQNLEGNFNEKRKKFTTKKGKFSKKRTYPLKRAWKL